MVAWAGPGASPQYCLHGNQKLLAALLTRAVRGTAPEVNKGYRAKWLPTLRARDGKGSCNHASRSLKGVVRSDNEVLRELCFRQPGGSTP